MQTAGLRVKRRDCRGAGLHKRSCLLKLRYTRFSRSNVVELIGRAFPFVREGVEVSKRQRRLYRFSPEAPGLPSRNFDVSVYKTKELRAAIYYFYFLGAQARL